MQIIFFIKYSVPLASIVVCQKQLSLINHDIRGHFYARTSEYAGFFLTLSAGP